MECLQNHYSPLPLHCSTEHQLKARQTHIRATSLWLQILIAATLKGGFIKSSHCTWVIYCYSEQRPLNNKHLLFVALTDCLVLFILCKLTHRHSFCRATPFQDLFHAPVTVKSLCNKIGSSIRLNSCFPSPALQV